MVAHWCKTQVFTFRESSVSKIYCVKSVRFWSYSGPNAGKCGPE